jgi:hypothetical protein
MRSPSSSIDPFSRGVEYLHSVQRLAPDPGLINFFDLPDATPEQRLSFRLPIYTAIGDRIAPINARLHQHLQACHDCFYEGDRQSIQVLAAPFVDRFGIDGICNLDSQPRTILVDVGRVVPEHWLRLVCHEYVHAHIGYPGHHETFAKMLSHLCLGLGLPPPPSTTSFEALRHFPVYQSTLTQLGEKRGAIAFWQQLELPYSKH